MHKSRFLNFSVDTGNTVKSYAQLINIKLSPKIPANKSILENSIEFVHISTDHNTITTNYFKEEKERGKNEIYLQ